ncbi:hypothetical protein BJV78DRAFT_1279696 [Lactifluus subvellereus]|nr:hypothetical protein BJV78DRAFT_1279696 [Lactifluus subvellereus]
MYQYAKRDIHNFSELKYRTDFIQSLHPSGAMAAPLRKVSVNHNLILRRARIAGVAYPQQPGAAVPSLVPESSDGRSKSPLTSSSGATRVRSEGDSSYRSPFTPLVSSYPPGLYTAVAHNGPLRRRIEDFWDELEEFRGHLRRAQQLLLGWLYTLYQLMLLVGCHMAVVWLLPTPGTIWNSALGATDSLKFRPMLDGYSDPRSTTKGKRVSLGTPANAQVGNMSSSSDLLPGRLTPTLLDNPQPVPTISSQGHTPLREATVRLW